MGFLGALPLRQGSGSHQRPLGPFSRLARLRLVVFLLSSVRTGGASWPFGRSLVGPLLRNWGACFCALVNLIIVSAQFGCWPGGWRAYVSCFSPNVCTQIHTFAVFVTALHVSAKRKNKNPYVCYFSPNVCNKMRTFAIFRQTYAKRKPRHNLRGRLNY